jgi:MYXO-CTERM domain-containing protein
MKTYLRIAVCVGTVLFALNARADLFVSSYNTGQVLRYDQNTGAFLSVFASGGGLSNPEGLVFNADTNADGIPDFFVTSGGSNSVIEYDGSSGNLVGTFSTGLNGPIGMTVGPNGNLFVANFNDNTVNEYDGANGDFITNFASAGAPFAAIFGPDGNLYVTLHNAGAVEEYNGSSGADMGAFASGLNLPGQALTFGPNGDLFVGTNDNDVKYYSPTGTYLGEFVSGLSFTPGGMVFGPDGNLYVADGADNAVKEFNGTNGTFITDFVTSGSGGLNGPTFMTFEAVPEPGTAWVGFAVLLAAFVWRRRVRSARAEG